MKEALNKLCVNGVLKLEEQHLEAKGLIQISYMPRDFWEEMDKIYLDPSSQWKVMVESTHFDHKEDDS